jgi:hypothetical protein
VFVKLTVRVPVVGEPDNTNSGVPVKSSCVLVELQLTTVVLLEVVVIVPLVPKAIVFKVVPLILTVGHVQS